MQGTATSTNKLLFATALREYVALGWKPIPVVVFKYTDKTGRMKREKRPLVDWKRFQTSPVTEEDIRQWVASPFADFAGVELLTGEYSPLTFVVGVDFDQRDGVPDYSPWLDELEGAMRTKTASGGWHFYFRHTDELTNDTNIFGADKSTDATIVDLRGKGGVIVVGPTPLWSADPREDPLAEICSRYETTNSLKPNDLPPLPSIFLPSFSFQNAVSPHAPKSFALANGPVLPGQDRHGVAISIIMNLMATVKTTADFEHAKRTFNIIYKAYFPTEVDGGQEEIDKMFTWALDKLYQKRGKVPFVVASIVSDARKQAKKEINVEKAAGEWDTFTLKGIERAGESAVFRMEDGSSFSLPVDSSLSQSKIRNYFFVHTGVVLPQISSQGFMEIMRAIPVENIAGSDLTFTDLVQETLEEAYEDTEVFDDKPSALLVVRSRKYARYEEAEKTVLVFRLPRLLRDLRDDNRYVKRPEVVEALRVLHCYMERSSEFRYWTYERTQ